jgi:hypothetical protein
MRHIELTVPVSSPSFWNKPEIMTALLDTIEYVSGDHWTIHPVQGPSETLAKKQTSLDLGRGNYIALPFSDGMDSFLQWQLLKKEEPGINILRVHTSSRASNSKRNAAIDKYSDHFDQRLAMPVSLSVGDHAEPTYRTRTFLFFVMAGLAAHKFKTRRVVIGENGIGMLGPGLVPFGDECPPHDAPGIYASLSPAPESCIRQQDRVRAPATVPYQRTGSCACRELWR